MNSDPEKVQIHRRSPRIPPFTAKVFVETARDQQTWTIFSNKMVSHFVLGCRLQIWKYAGEGSNPLLSFSCSRWYHFHCKNRNSAGLCSSEACIDSSTWKGGTGLETGVMHIMGTAGASLLPTAGSTPESQSSQGKSSRKTWCELFAELVQWAASLFLSLLDMDWAG